MKRFLIFALCYSYNLCVYGQLELSSYTFVDVKNLNFTSLCGLAFDAQSQRLWVSDGTGVNMIASIDASTGQVYNEFSAALFGIQRGPDALAVNPTTGNIIASSAYLESKLAEFTPQGALIHSYQGSAYGQAAAAFTPDGQLILLDKNDGSMRFVNLENGTIQKTVPLIGYSSGIAAADYDPFTGHLFGYVPKEVALIEIDINSGQTLGFTDMKPFISSQYNFADGIAFNGNGDKLYYCGNLYGSQSILVLNRTIPEPATLLLLGLGGMVLRKCKQ